MQMLIVEEIAFSDSWRFRILLSFHRHRQRRRHLLLLLLLLLLPLLLILMLLLLQQQHYQVLMIRALFSVMNVSMMTVVR